MGVGAGVVLVITCLINSFLLAGVGFAVPQILYILKDEKVFEYLCSKETIEHDPGGDVCVDQEKKLVLIAQASLFGLFFSRLFVGWELDHFGPRVTSVVGALIVALGSFIFAISSDSAPENDPEQGGMRKRRNWFALGMFLIAVGGTGLHLSNFHTANLFPRWRRTIFAAISAVFTGSVFMFFIFSTLHFKLHISYHTLFYWYTLLALFVALVLHRMQQDQLLSPGDSVEFKLSRLRIQRVEDKPPATIELSPSSSTYQQSPASTTTTTSDTDKPPSTGTESDRINTNILSDVVPIRLQDLPFSQQVRRPEFLLLTLCFSSALLSIQFFVATFNDQIDRKSASPEQTSFYIDFFGTVASLGFVMMPISVFVMDGNRWWQGFPSAWVLQLLLVFFTNVLNLTPIALTEEEIVDTSTSGGEGSSSSSSVNSSSGSLEPEQYHLVYKPGVVYMICMLWSMSRYFMFTIFFAFTAEQFGQKTFGRITGTASVVASAIGLLVYPLADLTLVTFDGNYNYIHVSLAILVGSFLFWYPLYVKRTVRPI